MLPCAGDAGESACGRCRFWSHSAHAASLTLFLATCAHHTTQAEAAPATPAAPTRKPGSLSKEQVWEAVCGVGKGRRLCCVCLCVTRSNVCAPQKLKLRQEYLGFGGAESACRRVWAVLCALCRWSITPPVLRRRHRHAQQLFPQHHAGHHRDCAHLLLRRHPAEVKEGVARDKAGEMFVYTAQWPCNAHMVLVVAPGRVMLHRAVLPSDVGHVGTSLGARVARPVASTLPHPSLRIASAQSCPSS